MKKIHFTLLIALSSVFFSAGVIAQNQPLACQSDESAGLSWENGRWKVGSFVPKKFILVQTNGGLTNTSVANAFGASVGAENVRCGFNYSKTLITCNEPSGDSLIFNPQNLKGGIAKLFGTIMSGDTRDTPYLYAFSCASF